MSSSAGVIANPFIVAADFAKSADGEAYDWTANNARLSSQAGTQIGQIGLGALGAGVAARGLAGLWNLAKRKLNPPKAQYPGALVTSIPYPVEAEAEEDPRHRKMAELPAEVPHYTAPSSLPWYLPAAMGVAGLGAYGGWKGMDALLNSRRKADMTQETDDAKREFESAMLDSYAKPRAAIKTAGDHLGEALDALYDCVVEKSASWSNLGGMLSDDTSGWAKGLYGAYALGTGALAGKMMYDHVNRNSDRASLERATQMRARRSYLARPSEVLAVPAPTPVAGNPADDEDVDQTQQAEALALAAAEPGRHQQLGIRPRHIDVMAKAASLAK